MLDNTQFTNPQKEKPLDSSAPVRGLQCRTTVLTSEQWNMACEIKTGTNLGNHMAVTTMLEYKQDFTCSEGPQNQNQKIISPSKHGVITSDIRHVY